MTPQQKIEHLERCLQDRDEAIEDLIRRLRRSGQAIRDIRAAHARILVKMEAIKPVRSEYASELVCIGAGLQHIQLRSLTESLAPELDKYTPPGDREYCYHGGDQEE